MPYYINFYFDKIIYDEFMIIGEFSAPDRDVICSFSYDRIRKETTIWNNNKSEDEILPLPIYWLLSKLSDTGYLNENEKKISY